MNQQSWYTYCENEETKKIKNLTMWMAKPIMPEKPTGFWSNSNTITEF